MVKRDEKIDELMRLFLELYKLMKADGENNWIRGISGCLYELENGKACEPDGLERARDIYRSMNKGNGSFSDYYIWRDDFQQRKEINDELDVIKSCIEEIFNN